MRIPTTLKTLLGIAAAAAMLGAAPAHAQATADPGQKAAAGAPAGAASTMAKADQKILMDMAQANMAEVEMAKLAQGKSQNDQVKTFAQQMIDDHSKALTDIQQMATSKNVTLPTELDKTHKAMHDKLSAMSGDAFDKAYMAQAGVSDHKKMHGMLASSRKKARDPDLKAMIARIVPTVDQHLKAAQQMGSARRGAKSDKPPAGTEAGK